MKCRVCMEDKLSKEFPSDTITDECNHPVYYCLRCVTKKVRESWKCPYEECGLPVAENSIQLKECEDTLNFLFPEIINEEYEEPEMESASDPSQLVIHVTTLTGDSSSFRYKDKKTIRELKEEIAKKMNVEIDKQRLVYNGVELKIYKEDSNENQVTDYGIKPFATIHLMIMLYSIPESLNHVIFDLSWTYPSHGRDFLDASCLMFIDDVWYSFVDWRAKKKSFMWHSGDCMDDINQKGHHKLEVELKKVPKCVSHLVFVLSSFRSPTIAHFRNPSLTFYDAANDSKQLCETSFQHALNCQMVVVCCVSRMKNGSWRIDKGGQASAGNVKGYKPAVKTIQQLIKSGCFTGVSLEPGESRIRKMTPAECVEFELRCKKR